MAQRTEKEETEFKVVLETLPTPPPPSTAPPTSPTTTTLCSNNCGNPSTNNKNTCQKCFNATSGSILKRSARSINLKSSSSSSSSSQPTTNKIVIRNKEIDAVKKRDQTIVNRCSGCKKKVGLTGFRCRCGELFCSEHRYSDRHDCSYDYKTAGREAIARENPVVKAAKMVKV